MQDRLARIAYNLGGGRVPFVFSAAVVGSLANAAETVVCTTPPLNPGNDSPFVILLGIVTVTAGTNATLLNLKCRQGTTALGPNAGLPSTITAVAGTQYAVAVMGVDTPGAVAGLQYSLTGQATAATAVSLVQFAFLMALAMG
jgi:hypothetical protein